MCFFHSPLDKNRKQKCIRCSETSEKTKIIVCCNLENQIVHKKRPWSGRWGGQSGASYISHLLFICIQHSHLHLHQNRHQEKNLPPWFYFSWREARLQPDSSPSSDQVFGSKFGAIVKVMLAPIWGPKRTSKPVPTASIFNQKLDLLLDLVLISLSFILEFKTGQEKQRWSPKVAQKSNEYNKMHFWPSRFWYVFTMNLEQRPSQDTHKRAKNPPQTLPETFP